MAGHIVNIAPGMLLWRTHVAIIMIKMMTMIILKICNNNNNTRNTSID
jgi:hypothetical protein